VNIGNAARIGRDNLEPGLRALAERHSVIGEVRGRGVFWALELGQDQATRTPVTADYKGRLDAELPGLGAGSSAEQDCGFVVALLRNGLQLAQGLVESHLFDFRAFQGNHGAPEAFHYGVDRGHAQPGGEHTVER
jgi:hypothetical protein